MVECLIETLGQGGGFVFSSCHNIQPDVSAEKVVAMFEQARGYVPILGETIILHTSHPPLQAY